MVSEFQGAPPLGRDQLACNPKPVSQNICCTENSNPWISVLLPLVGAVTSQMTRGSPGCPRNGPVDPVSVTICANTFCADGAVPAACSSAIALVASAPAFGSVMPNSDCWVVTSVRKFGDVLGEPVGRHVAARRVIPLRPKVDVIRLVGQQTRVALGGRARARLRREGHRGGADHRIRSDRAMVLLYDPRNNKPDTTSKLISKFGRNSL